MNETHGPIIDYRLCNGCQSCYDNCPLDVFAWDEGRHQPICAYPGECWHCGICELECSQQAIDVKLALQARLFLGV